MKKKTSKKARISHICQGGKERGVREERRWQLTHARKLLESMYVCMRSLFNFSEEEENKKRNNFNYASHSESAADKKSD